MKRTIGVLKKILGLALCMSMVIPLMPVCEIQTMAATTAFEKSISAFPDDYKTYLRQLHEAHPKWVFEAFDTGIDWDTAVNAESSNNKSLVQNVYSDFLKSNASGDYNTSTGSYIYKDSGSWVTASKATVAYYMDPRNFLTEQYVFMFENLSYDSTNHTKAGVEEILSGTFMSNKKIAYYNTSGTFKKNDSTYSTAIMTAAKQSGVSPYYLASKIVQEIGSSGTTFTYSGVTYSIGNSGSVNGKYGNYHGYYNFYNIGASDGTDPISNGLAFASSGSTYNRTWTSPRKAIIGGAQYLGTKFINCGQYTGYFQRFNVNSSGTYSLFTHQYMTAITSLPTEAASTYSAYNEMGSLDTVKTFVIPIYNNMPSQSTTVKLGKTSGKTGTVNSAVTLRKGPSTSYDKIAIISKGTTVSVTKGIRSKAGFGSQFLNNPYWYKVKVTINGKSYTGYVAASYVTMSSEAELYIGYSKTLKTTLSNATTDETVYYMSDNPAIAKVDSNGVVTGVAAGTTTIRAYTASGSMSACGVTVARIGVTLNKSTITIDKGSSQKLKATVYTKLSDSSVTWSTSDKKIATVTQKGTVKGISSGTVTITVTTTVDSKKASCKVQVINPVTGVTLNKTSASLYVGGTCTLTSTILPADATIQDVTWSSSDESVAVVSSTGKVTAKSAGKATITVTSVNKGYTAQCTVVVKPAKITGVTVKGTAYDRVKISWDAQNDVTGYKIFKLNTSTNQYELIGTVDATKTSYTDKKLTLGTEYSYKVRAYRTVSGKTYNGKKSSPVTGSPAVGKGKITSLENKSNSVKINIKKVSGATSYRIYRKAGKDGKYKALVTINANTLTYTDKTVEKKVTYYYKVQAIRVTKSATYKGKKSSEISVSR